MQTQLERIPALMAKLAQMPPEARRQLLTGSPQQGNPYATARPMQRPQGQGQRRQAGALGSVLSGLQGKM